MILNFTNSKLNHIIIHYVGNKNNDDGYVLSNYEVKNDNKDIEGLLINYFLSPFKDAETFRLWHESDINLNPLYSYVSDIFSKEGDFIEKSQSITKHLYECSLHPNIKQGDLFIAELSNCIYGEEVVNVIVIFKSENKDDFLQSIRSNNRFELHKLSGININKIDKAAIVFNTEKHDGYRVCAIDNSNKNKEAAYWKDSFLKLINCTDEFFHTTQFLSLTKNYLTNQFEEDFEVSKADKIDLLNRSVGYFKNHETFERSEFEKKILRDPKIIESFRDFDSNSLQLIDSKAKERFNISLKAVKRQTKVFKSVLKLDKNFHIYIHGNRELIEQGIEDNGRKYYKIYYESES